MSKQKNAAVLDDALTSAIAINLLPTTPAPEVASRIKEKLLSKVQSAQAVNSFIFAGEGDWKTIAVGVQAKVLRQEANSRSMLFKMAANSSIPAHYHAVDEEAIVLEGEVWLEGVLCRMGDYHHACAGGEHQEIYTERGCLLFIRNA